MEFFIGLYTSHWPIYDRYCSRISYLGLCHTVYNHFLRNGIGCHSIPPRRFFAFCRGSLFRLCPICLWKLIFSLWFYFFQLCWVDSCNYTIGHFFGNKLFNNPDSRIFKQSHLEKTHEFYKKYGGKTIIIARFVPIVRTFAPFVAGMGKMHYYYFMVYNLIGGTLWVGIFCYAGYFFGDLPFVQKNLKLLIVAIIVVSILPAVIEVGRNKWKTRNY